MRKGLIIAILIVAIGGIGLSGFLYTQNKELLTPISKKAQEIVEKPLEKYSFPRLQKSQFAPSSITFGSVTKDEPQFTSRMVYFSVEGKKVSGLLNTPTKAGVYPLIVMFRGFVPQERFTSGEGTRRSGEAFAQNGFVTIAPDFLGFGESDMPTGGPMAERLLTYPTALTLLNSVDNLKDSLAATDSGNIQIDTQKVGIWGHSNGGHISLSVLAITGKPYPTVLWNPVTKPFPYSVLYFTDEYDDNGKGLRKVIADFEKDYDVELYSPSNYYDKIVAPIQFHQGVEDEAVPVKWSNQFVELMKEKDKDIVYFTYPGDNHDFSRGSWSTVVQRNIEFFNKEFAK